MTRATWLSIGVAGVVLLALPAVIAPPKRLLWNASASAPEGLYSLTPARNLRIGDLVAIQPPRGLATALAIAHYLPEGVPLLKHVAALPGQTVCRTGADVTIDGMFVARAFPRDRRGRPLPSWSGCKVLRLGQVFVLNPAVRDSLDGRYFGPLPTSGVLGRPQPLWLRSGG